MHNSVTLIRPLVNIEMKLRDIPRNWLIIIEPKIIRAGFEPCWIYTGGFVPNNRPIIRDPSNGKMTTVQRVVAKMFWDFPDELWVYLTCRRTDCVNPAHIWIGGKHAKPPKVKI